MLSVVEPNFSKRGYTAEYFGRGPHQSEHLKGMTPGAESQNKNFYTLELVLRLRHDLLQSTQGGIEALRSVLPATKACQILEDGFQLIRKEPTLLEASVDLRTCSNTHSPFLPIQKRVSHILQVDVKDPVEVLVVGDTHGQLHDVCGM